MTPPDAAATTPVGATLLGTGHLGAAIGRRLLAEGHALTVWNRTPRRCEALAREGARVASDPLEAAAAADPVITVLSDGRATRSVLESGAAALPGRLVIQMGTIAPPESRALGDWLDGLGARYLEAPVLGSKPEALAGRLQLMVAGPAEDLARARPLLRCLGGEPRHLGQWGQALTAKLALNQLIASLTHAFSLSLHLALAGGVPADRFMELLRPSALYAPTFDKKLPRMLADDFGDANFPLAHLRKDLLLFLEAAGAAGLDASGLSGLADLLQAPAAAALDGRDYSALHRLTGPGART